MNIENSNHAKLLLPYQQRVVDEKIALDEKLEKLNNFFITSTFANLPATEQFLLKRQANAMEEYSSVLGERLIGF